MPLKKPAGDTDSRVSAALKHLKAADPILYAAALPHKDLLAFRSMGSKLPSAKQLFASLAGSVTGQQLSTKAAETIRGRLEVVCGGAITPEAIQKLDISVMRSAGLSAAKVKTLKELSEKVLSGELKLLSLRKMPEDEAVAKLSSVWGIGRWTAEMFLMFALEREDVFSPGDLGLRRAIEALYGLPKDVPIKELETIALRWSPYRTVASRALWRIRDSA